MGLRLSRGFHGRTIFVADAHRDEYQRFIVRADERLTAFVEFESAISRRVPPSDGLALRAIGLLIV